jgi:hypothetical protein
VAGFFFATLKAVPSRGIFQMRLAVARQWLFSAIFADKNTMLEELKYRAEICGFEKLEVFSVGRIEAVNWIPGHARNYKTEIL